MNLFYLVVLSAFLLTLPLARASDEIQSLLAPGPSLDAQELCDSHCTAPKLVTAFPADKAREAFIKASRMTEAELVGHWMLVGFAMTDEAISVWNGEGDAKLIGYDANGLRNADGDLRMPLSIDRLAGPFGSILAVTIKNIGSKNSDQGPYELELRSGGACFSTVAYNRDHLSKTRIYYEIECRKAHGLLLCQSTYRSGANDSTLTAVLNGKPVHYFGYIKK